MKWQRRAERRAAVFRNSDIKITLDNGQNGAVGSPNRANGQDRRVSATEAANVSIW